MHNGAAREAHHKQIRVSFPLIIGSKSGLCLYLKCCLYSALIPKDS